MNNKANPYIVSDALRSCANLIIVFIHTNRFSENDRQSYNSKTLALPVATNSNIELIHYASIALKEIGVIVSEIVPENQIQLDLLDTVDREKHARMMSVMDGLTDKFGRGRVRVATQGVDNAWTLKSEFKSPCYTTRIDEIQKVYVR